MNKTQTADTLALAARVFVRRARSEGHANQIDEMCFLGLAQTRGWVQTDGWVLRRAARLTVDALRDSGEWDLIDWNDSLFKPLRPRSWA